MRLHKTRCRRLRAALCASFRFLGAVVPVGRGKDSGLVDDDAPVREVNVRSRPISTSTTRENLSVQPVEKSGHSSLPFVSVAPRLPLSKPELTRTIPTRYRFMMLLSRSRPEMHYLALLVLGRF